MDIFRLSVAAILNGTAPPPVIIPPNENGRKTLRRGDTGDLVQQMQTRLGVEADGKFGANTKAAARAFQRAHGLVPDGIVGPKT